MTIRKNSEGFGGDYFAIMGKNIICKKDKTPLSAEDIEELKAENSASDFFCEDEFKIGVLSIDNEAKLSEKYEQKTLRSFFYENNESTATKAARAKALVNWRRDTKYCCSCGEPLTDSTEFSARECTKCGKIFFPKIEPCVIVLVNKGEKILLAKHVQRNQDIYACIAGFIESGESVEQAVKREIMEETGLTVKNIRYRGSQSWPFPDQLMLAFTAEYESGEITLQKEEISDAQWFDRNNCPASPQPGSIAYKLIHNEI